MTPFEASSPSNKSDVLKNLYSNIKPTNSINKFNVGDRVRITRYKKHFEKGYTPKWTKEIFVINEVNSTNPITYKLKDLADEQILGSFYTEELQKTKF
jgi:hypothetical protein